jgi:hypothetical protein
MAHPAGRGIADGGRHHRRDGLSESARLNLKGPHCGPGFFASTAKNMNFRTTVILIVLLVIAGVWLFIDRTSTKPLTPSPENGVQADTGKKILDISETTVTKVEITPASGTKIVLTKKDSKWRLTEPVDAPADQFAVDDLVRSLTDMRSKGAVDTATAGAAKYTVTLEAAGKTSKFALSDKSLVGDTVYVTLDGASQSQVASADAFDKLDKPVDDLRDKQLVSTPSTEIKQVRVEGQGTKFALAKTAKGWEITEPQKMPAEETAASDILYAITGLRAVGFAGNDVASLTGLDKPVATISFSTAAPGTQPSASQPAMTTIALGRYEDIRKQNIYATIVGSNVIARVPATILESIKKQPLDLRDKKAIDIEPADVTEIRLSADKSATTQPTTKPAIKKEIVLQLRPPEATSAPTTAPTTGPSTKPSTKPALSKWLVREMGTSISADDGKVASLLADLHPLRADKYLATAPTTRPVAQYALRITSGGIHGLALTQYELHITDPGGDKPLIGQVNGLSFEMSRSILPRFEENYVKDTTTPIPSSQINDKVQ